MGQILVFIVLLVGYGIEKSSTNDNCTCVSLYQCATKNAEGIGLLDVRTLHTSSCPGHFEICCNSSNIVQPDLEIDRPSIKLNGCGYQNSGFFPWSAALLYRAKNTTNLSYRCGVSLINKKAVITAAHCLDQEKPGGAWTLRLGNVVRGAAKIIIHPQYNPATLHNDITLILLNTPVNLSRKIGTICLPPKGISFRRNSRCNAAAWVKNFNNHKKTYSYLKMIRLPVVSKDKCEHALRTTRLGNLFQLHNSFICAGGQENLDTCGGDGGSPLVCPVLGQPGRYHQVGIVSWGIGCGENNVPGVYVKLSNFRDWIDEEMTKNGLDITSYRY